MEKKIPTFLKKSPIVESVFEIRYSSEESASAIIPGILHGGLSGSKKILPVPPIPVEIIQSDPAMQNIPTFSMEWDNFIINGNPLYVGISFKPPYKRWAQFREGIADIHRVLMDSGVFSAVNRYSVKYIDFIDENDDITAMSLLDLHIDIHSKAIEKENIALRIELPEEKYVHVINIATSALVTQHMGTPLQRRGLLIDTDTICDLREPIQPKVFLEEHSRLLADIHLANKTIFFKTLSQQGIDYLEPEYE